MSVIRQLANVKSSSLSKPKSWLKKIYNGIRTKAGANVTEQNSLKLSPVWSCVKILSEDIASLPLKTYRELNDGGKEPAKDHYLYETLHTKANTEMTAFTLRETLMGHILTWGNAYAEIEKDNGGRVKNLWPLLPHRTHPKRLENGNLIYRTKIPGYGIKELTADKVLHVHGLGYDGLVGYSPITMHRQSIGLTKAAEEYGQRFFGNDSRPGGVLKTDETLSDDARRNLKKSWENAHQSLEDKHRIAVLEHGLEWQQIGLPPEDSQFINTRKFQNHEIARIYRVPPHMIAEMENATFSNIEEQSLAYVQKTLRPWLVRWEQEINTTLFGKTNRKYFAEHLVDGLLRGDIDSRYSAYATGRQWGWLSANDVREKENMNPIENGDIYLVPQNMTPADMVEEMAERDIRQPEEVRDIWEKKKEIIEQRQRRRATERLKEEEKFKPLIRESIQEVVERETSNIMRNANRIFEKEEEENSEKRDSVEKWETFLDDYYRDFQDYIERKVRPVFSSEAKAIAAIAAEEIDYNDMSDEEIEDFVDDYTEAYASRHTDSSKGQLIGVIRDAREDEENELEYIEQRMDEWEERRAEKQSSDEAVQLGNAVAQTVFISGGVTQLIWENTGDDTCPYCQELDGKTVPAGNDFLPAGESLKAEEEDHPMKVYKPASHPPIHQSCQCQLVPN